MRRAILAVTGMVAGTTLLISLKSAPGASRLPDQVAADAAAAARAAAIASASASAAQPSPGASASPGPAPGPGQVPAPSQGGQPAPGTTTKAPPATSAGPAPKPTQSTRPPAPPANQGTFTGDSKYTEFGYVTVAITVSGGKITDVTAIELPSNEPRSVSISAKAGPTLRQRALAAQSSKIDSVSGATYTSAAYKTSLQSAIDKAGLGQTSLI